MRGGKGEGVGEGRYSSCFLRCLTNCNIFGDLVSLGRWKGGRRLCRESGKGQAANRRQQEGVPDQSQGHPSFAILRPPGTRKHMYFNLCES